MSQKQEKAKREIIRILAEDEVKKAYGDIDCIEADVYRAIVKERLRIMLNG